VQLALIHRALGSHPAPANSTAWRTCLREIHFLHNSEAVQTGTLTGADAYALLLEVVCGLRSPLIGETEVQAQFKQFLASPTVAANPGLQRLGQRVLGDAKRIRYKHLQGFGAHSYGQLTARHLVGDHLVVIGTGALACQVVMSAPPRGPSTCGAGAADARSRHGRESSRTGSLPRPRRPTEVGRRQPSLWLHRLCLTT
jgi:glutamyl-tRNA reductase